MKKLLLFILFPILVSFAQISISSGGSNVSENFNSMGTSATATLPTNWKADKLNSVRTIGLFTTAGNSVNYIGGNNSTNAISGNGIYNFGLGAPTTATDRALGGISSGTGSQSINIYAYFKNTGTQIITQVDLSYDVMRFRNGTNSAGFSIVLYYSSDGTTWSPAGSGFINSFAPNGDILGAAVVPMETQQILNQTLTGLNIAQNGSLYLAWNYSVTSGTITTNAQALGIDNFLMSSIGGTSTSPAAAIATSATNITQTGFKANWNVSAGATSYLLDVSTSASFSSYLSGYQNKNVGNVLSFDVTNLTLNTTYYYRVWGSNSYGTSGNSSNNISVTTLPTTVQFVSLGDAVIKSAGTYNLVLSITTPNVTSATTCSITFVADSSTAPAAYLNNYSTQTVTFPAGSSANQQVVFTIWDDVVVEPAKKAFLQIQNVSGGTSAQAGAISKFRLSITSGVNNAYYSSIPAGLTGTALKTALYNRIKGHTKYPYTDNSSSTSIDVWKMLKAADEDPKNPSNVIAIYSGLSIPQDPTTSWNREHVWSKSHGPFSETVPGAGTDGHHLRPENPTVNSTKSNLDFDNGGNLVPNGGGSKYIVGSSWEPRDEVKGDIARMIFYMATRYQGESGEPNLQVVDYIPSAPLNQPLYAKLSTLLAWNQQDPPDAFEMNRNNWIYFYQRNRNPYIDHPEWVSSMFGSTSSFTVTTSSIPTAGGITSGGGTYNSGISVTVTATPNTGYTFTNWTESGSVVSTSSTYIFSISGNKTLAAYFSIIPSLSVAPDFLQVNSTSGTQTFNVTNTTGGTMNWSATSNVSWITLISGNSGTNSGIINFSYQANTGNARVGTITITTTGALGSPKTVEIRQALATSVEYSGIGIPTKYGLNQNFPNPFNPETVISYQLPTNSFVTLKVYNLLGIEVANLVNEYKPAGIYGARFNTQNYQLPSGVYLYKLQAGEFIQAKKMVLMK